MDTSAADGLKNPFEVTKATDFDDRQIASTWVDFPGGGGFRSLIDPRSPVARFVLGGKGSGRTHLMRYYSSSLQAMRLAELRTNSIAAEGYIGIYINSSTLNAGRFAGKGGSADTWSAVFAYYFDLWIAVRVIMSVDELRRAVGHAPSTDNQITVSGLFDAPSQAGDGDALDQLSSLLRELDIAINKAAITRDLNVTIRSSPGKVLFGVIDRLGAQDALREVQFALLVDEFENFSAPQQQYVNTLIRHKRPRTSFLVGARTGGVKTYATLSGEINREGSEFETIPLDSLHLRSPTDYRRFCRALVARRLVESGLLASTQEREAAKALDRYFVTLPRTRLGEQETRFVAVRSAADRKAVDRLKRQLTEYRPGHISDQEIDKIIDLLRRPESPLLEKLGIYLFYRAWNQREPPGEAATQIHNEADDYIAGGQDSHFALAMGHFRNDMLAQLLSEYRQKSMYVGFGEFIELSGGLPRALLVVLKHVYRWAIFNGERPFVAEHPISIDSQRTGVAEASTWFFQDLPGIGPDGASAQAAVERLGNFLKALRFSDKPTESSLSTIGIEVETLTGTAKSVVEHCVEFSFLLEIRNGHTDRNTRMRRQKLQLHPMLCPLWDLPTSRRGVVELAAEEALAIFDQDHASKIVSVTRNRLRRMNAPFRSIDEPKAGIPNLYD